LGEHWLMTKKVPEVFIVLPAYNAEKTLLRTLAEIPAVYRKNIILVDDHSSDRTVELALQSGMTVFQHATNKGYGANQKTCYTQALAMGADIVVHSTTKYLGGHSDVVGGAVVVKKREIYEKLAFLQNAVGAVPGPMDCFLVLRGIKTLPLRMDRHAGNAAALVAFLSGHPKVERTLYPFHPSQPQHKIAMQQMTNGGGMISFVMKAGREAAVRVAENTKIFTLAESLGGVESLIEVPAAMTHLSTSGSQIAVDPGLVRLSVGVEHVDDLLADLRQALGRA